MAEMIFILVTLYGVYVIYTTTSQSKEQQEVLDKPIPLMPNTTVVKAVKKDDKKVAVKKANSSVKKAAKIAKTAVSTKMPGGSVRNPETGEVARMANNYRMCKRWIKEALVAEGFLDKIYKTNELDDDTKAKINAALKKLMAMDSYHA